MIVNDDQAQISIDGGPEIFTNSTHLVVFERAATINGTRYVNQREAPNKASGIAGSPLLNIISYDPVLSMPLRHRMNNQDLHTIQEFMEEMTSTWSPKMWFVTGVRISLMCTDSFPIFQVLRKRRESLKVQRVIDSFSVTGDGHNLEEK
ncbi:hypothetical protein KR093_000349 [Drosophila rubida]|uniref:Uncharacterized protein n=1 Tax=Drosophila rubida TaxID=30044 RepID=A0AAD4K8Q6_9MUSC|nr:hypothetical protein KR093_000349 [Drosophila rubida]